MPDLWAMKRGDSTLSRFAGSDAGIRNALAYAGAGGIAQLSPGNFSIDSPLNLPAGFTLSGCGYLSTIISASSAFSGAAMIQNSDQTGGQQSCAIRELEVDGNKASATVPIGIQLKSLGQPTYVDNVVVHDCSGNGIVIDGDTSVASTFYVPYNLDNVWVNSCNDDNILIQGNVGAVWLRNVTSEFVAANKSLIKLNGTLGGFVESTIHASGLHLEFNATGCVGVDVVNWKNVLLQSVVYVGAVASGDIVKMSGADTFNVIVQNLRSYGTVTNVINDTVNSVTIVESAGQLNLPWYSTDALNPRTIALKQGLTVYNDGSFGLTLQDGTIAPIAASGSLTLSATGATEPIVFSTNGSERGRFDATGALDLTTSLEVGGTKVVGAQGAAVADATDAASAITQLNALLARLRTHGLIAT